MDLSLLLNPTVDQFADDPTWREFHSPHPRPAPSFLLFTIKYGGSSADAMEAPHAGLRQR
jgi:hypothetical protein